jgi:Histidine kinase
MATTTKTFLNKPENLFTDQSRQVDILFWILIFTLYFIDFKDSRKEELFALCLATVNVGLGAAIAYVHYMLVRLLLEKKVLPVPALGRKKVEVSVDGVKTMTQYYPTFFNRRKYHLNIIFPVYFILTIGLIVLDGYLYNVWGNRIAEGIKPIIDAINTTKATAAHPFEPFKLPELRWTSNIPEATMIIYVFTGIMYALRYHRQHIETNVVRERNELEIEALRWQLKPHFLLASLNSLYHAVEDADNEKGLRIVKLMSKMTRYVVDEASYYKPSAPKTKGKEKEINRVPLSKEVDFIKNFIELKQFEKGHKTDYVQLAVAPFDSEYLITPMILICYVENAFKHGLDKDKQKRAIRIDIKVEQDTLYFSVFNHKPAVNRLIDQDVLTRLRQENQEERTTNMGMEATKKLLKAAYPNRFTFDPPKENDQTFEIKLSIKLDKQKI